MDEKPDQKAGASRVFYMVCFDFFDHNRND